MRKTHFMQKLPGKYTKNIIFVCSILLSRPKLSVLNNHQALQCLLTLIGSSNSQECLPFICSQYHQTQGRQSRLSKLAVISRRLGHIKAISNNDLSGGLCSETHKKCALLKTMKLGRQAQDLLRHRTKANMVLFDCPLQKTELFSRNF